MMKDTCPIVLLFLLVTLIPVNCGRTSPPPKEDSVPPIIISTIPDDESLNNIITTTITLVFSESIDPASVTSDTISVRNAMTGVLIEEDIACDDNKVVLAPRSAFQIFTVYDVKVTTGVRDIAGNAMMNPVRFTFTTGAQGDSTSPDIFQTIPERGAIGAGVNTAIWVTFTEPMLASSITGTPSPLTVSAGATAVPGSIMLFDGRTVIFTPVGSLDYSTTYTVLVSDSVTDLAGNHPLWGNSYMWEFTSQMPPQDSVRPIVVSTTPADYATNVPVSAQITVVFDENMLATSITASTFLLTEIQTGVPVPGKVSVVSGATATFTAANSLKYATDYVVTLITSTEGIRDNAGNPLVPNSSQGYTWGFKTELPRLTVAKTGTGSGIVSANTGTITWTGNVGTAVYPDYGTPVTLTAAASEGSTFAGWSGEGCAGTGICTVTMTTARNVTATFTLSGTYSLTVTSAGTGTGIVSASTGTLSWSDNIGTAAYTEYGTQVILTATPSPESTFIGWSGACSGTGDCTLIMTEARNVTATFMYNSYLLTVIRDGTGSGIVSANTVTLTWTGITSTATYTVYGTEVTLTATADLGSRFAGWSGEGCTGTGACTVTMTAARNVTATFTIYTTLTVTKKGKGSGDVTVDTGTLIWNGTKGTASYSYNTQVTMTATADSDSVFAGWSGEGCTGTGTCTVVMTAARAVSANFNELKLPP